jgi:hypothetical protein
VCCSVKEGHRQPQPWGSGGAMPPTISWGKAGEGKWQKVGDPCSVCGPEGCDHTHPPTGLEQSLEEMEFTRSACQAAQIGDLEKLRRMIERNPGAVYHDGAEGRSGYTPLHYAARSGHEECVTLLLQSGASVHARTSAGGATPLMRAAFAGHAQICQMLLRAGAAVNAQDADGDTALHKAAQQQHKELFRLLQQHSGHSGEQLTNRRGQRAYDLFQASAG